MGRYWLGIDIGGTFTDFTLHDRATHDVTGLKVASTPPDFGMAVEDGLERLAREHAINLSEIDVVVHGTTIAVNTLIQRTGARLGLLVTEGFRDVLEIQRLRLPNPLDLHGRRPEPLIPRGRVAEVRERLRARLAEQGIEGLVISLLQTTPRGRSRRSSGEAGRRHVTVIEPMIGGGGGRPGRDGVDGCDASLGFLKTTPAETLEVEVPALIVRRFHLVADSAGPGRWRGGHAVRLDVQVVRPEGLVTARGMERLRFAPWGVAGGRAGATGCAVLNPGTPGERALPKIDVLALEPGDVLSVRTPGGGGHGDPLERPIAEVLADVEAGLVTAAHARDAYGVVLAKGAIDEAATAALRAERRATGSAPAPFHFGPARDVHERRWPSALQDAFIALLMSLPVPYRAYVRRALYARVTALADERPVTVDDLSRLWEELAAASALPVQFRKGGDT